MTTTAEAAGAPPTPVDVRAPCRRVIKKSRGEWGLAPNLLDYEQARASFSWASARAELDGLPGGTGLNIAHEAVDRHVAHGRGGQVALRWLGRHGEERDVTYADLARESRRFANVLARFGVGFGDRVFVLADRIPEVHVTALGALRRRCVFSPLFSAFGPDPIRARLAIGEGKVLVTTPTLYRKKVAGVRSALPRLEHVLLVGDEREIAEIPATHGLGQLMASVSDEHAIEPTAEEDAALLHFTSGTTGTPKGAMHVHAAVIAHHITGRLALDLHTDDIFWCTADPGWVTGTSYGIIAPLTNGVTSVIDEGDFDADRWYRVLQDRKVTVWYTAPTAIRMLIRAGSDLARRYDLRALRLIASVGEPLDPEAVAWGQEALGLPIHDNWWQTETGGIMIANLRSMDIRPGSMGRPLPGIDAGIVARTEAGAVAVQPAGVQGELALKPGWPSMFRAYLGEEERYRKCFVGGWYLTGDLARQDADGYFWFIGRVDDLIKSAGHLIGPFEVESCLLEHAAVAEAAVIGKPDPVIGEVVKAFVALKDGFTAGEPVRLEILAHARRRLGAVVAPKEITFVDTVPKTRSGKIMRRLLKARELGLPEGDTSTLEGITT